MNAAIKNNFKAIFLFAAILAFTGCEDAEEKSGVSWNGSAPKPAPAATPAQTSSTKSAPASTAASTSSAARTATASAAATAAQTKSESLPASSSGGLNWTFGGINGSGAVQSGVTISGLSFSSHGLSFRYGTNLSAWGLGYTTAGAYACLFVQRSDGRWVGGKFDWISSSRTSRDFENVFHGYGGWSLAGVPNPCRAAFLILSRDTKKRSNILYGTWKR